MQFIIIPLLLLVFSTRIQAEWKWVIFEKESFIINGQEEVVKDWKAVGIFLEKNICQEYENLRLYYIANTIFEAEKKRETRYFI